MRKRRSGRRSEGASAASAAPALPDHFRSLDLLHGRMAYGRRFPVPNIVADATRERLTDPSGTAASAQGPSQCPKRPH
jgi:hypothetical protein